ncbi:MAG: imidazole glycerol phosphate synthase subunit HisF [Lachnospiraceae bacterium]|nr:imidazole glycerol phosphate synthase subunit HisF [Lachnospiraceae bacterium]MBP3469995.1 imidazole glycerol phosphate synthase subunit HisF [Lachnospiraceae bacterium]
MFTRPRIIPVLLYDDRDLIKTINFKDRTYLGDPVNAVKIFNRKGIDELSVLDIGATRNGREPDFDLLKDIASEAFMPLSCGGGITTLEQVHELLAIGYEKVVINSELVRHPKLITTAAEAFGSQSVVASIDAKLVNGQYKCVISDGNDIVDKTPVELAQDAERLGAGEIIINSVDRDGMMQGYDIKLVRSVVDAVKIPVTAIGGAGGIQDLKAVLREGNAHAAAGGSMFVYYGRLKAVLITAPSEEELTAAGIYSE